MKLAKLVLIMTFMAGLSVAALARNIYGYIGFGPSWFGTIVPCTVELYKENGQFVARTQSYYHPFGVFKARYHFNGNIGYEKYRIRVIPQALYGAAGTGLFHTEWAFWSDTKAPNVQVR